MNVLVEYKIYEVPSAFIAFHYFQNGGMPDFNHRACSNPGVIGKRRLP